MANSRWQFWIDRGGTFTDIVASMPGGGLKTAKLLSENPEHYDDAATEGIRRLLGLPAGGQIQAALVETVRMGTTVGTNALLEHKGETTVLVTTRGLKDQLRIGYQARPDIFARQIILPDMLYGDVAEIDERIGADGTVHVKFDPMQARIALQAAYDKGYRACAILFMHGYRYPQHEILTGDIARAIGFTQISLSHEVSPLIKYVRRGDTTVVDAYLSPILRRYVDKVAKQMPDVTLQFMQSHGGLTDAASFQGRDCIVSGPAGGIVGAVCTAQAAGFERILTFDMGGTSTDVAHFSGEYERTHDSEIAGARLQVPMLKIHTVAAGGGSICSFDGAKYRVGPESAGANPGPACYRRGGPLTITDCNVMLGRLAPAFFPAVFGPDGDEALDTAIVHRKFADLAQEIKAKTGDARSPAQVAQGFITIAVMNMANAIRKVSIQRGYDVTRNYVLNCFGGAGGQHACDVADALGVGHVLVHPLAGVLSAYGMGLADASVIREKSVEARLDSCRDLDAQFAQLEGDAAAHMQAQGLPRASLTIHRSIGLKYDGTDRAIFVGYGSDMERDFAAAYQRQYGFALPGKALIVEALRVEAVGHSPNAGFKPLKAPPTHEGAARTHVQAWADNGFAGVPLYDWYDLCAGQAIMGPAIISDPNATTFVAPGWRAVMKPQGWMVMDRVVARTGYGLAGDAARCDPVMLEVFNNLFMAIAEQMGQVLENTAYSVNIKERLDFSCALFDRDGGLIANAPHMPVHLGSMGQSVRHVMETRKGNMHPGDAYMLNDPYNGGTHLPDITVVSPVFDKAGQNILFYVASRGHHADVGGLTPGSMPPDSRTIEDEGVLIDDVEIVSRGHFRQDAVVRLFGTAKHPARNVVQNIGDLKAQLAANARGIDALHGMIGEFGLDVVNAYVAFVQANAEEMVRREIAKLKNGTFTYKLDNGAQIQVALTVDKQARGAVVDFTGTSAQLGDNFNAPSAVARAAVLYVFRTLVDDTIPMNEGCMRPITVVIPEGSMLRPRHPAAVVAGNVETSQCVTDALYGAMGVMAAAQGTMNNFTYGDDIYQYYETICGGSGAGAVFDGTSAIHTHMTNSRLTDPEVLELRYPVLLEEFSIRHGSGGKGRHNGGDGTKRRVRFLKSMTAAILANHRIVAPFGLEGGGDGDVGRAYILRGGTSREDLASTARVTMQAGDSFVIETPGGGGFGKA